MPEFALALPDEICLELGSRARSRRILANTSVEDLAAKIGVSPKTVGNFERTGRCTLETFVRILEALNATADLQGVLHVQTRSIEEMRMKAVAAPRQRAYRKSLKAPN